MPEPKIDFPTSPVWGDHYAGKTPKPVSEHTTLTPNEENTPQLLQSLQNLTGFTPPKEPPLSLEERLKKKLNEMEKKTG